MFSSHISRLHILMLINNRYLLIISVLFSSKIALSSLRFNSNSLRSLKSLRMTSAATTVTTYNVLSSSLSSPDYFNRCDPEACDPKNRLVVVKKKLEQEIAKKSIICLQEVICIQLVKYSSFIKYIYFTFYNKVIDRLGGQLTLIFPQEQLSIDKFHLW